ncbi:MAG: hypothetical protein KKG14_04165 [Alphaproteobacteria bacterium]|nr:hypothetical protein [Alphaproteobacteria bacterium]MBU2270035.1 hypothetical protein [Alphaproteobacteria bacterium]MBU2417878.1 hypothetical protein [Alphaproteobacteria bacterium]
MRKSIVVAALGLALMAGQSVAAVSNSAASRVGDRIGADASDASELAAALPLPVLLVAAAVVVAAVVVAADDDSESD